MTSSNFLAIAEFMNRIGRIISVSLDRSWLVTSFSSLLDHIEKSFKILSLILECLLTETLTDILFSGNYTHISWHWFFFSSVFFVQKNTSMKMVSFFFFMKDIWTFYFCFPLNFPFSLKYFSVRESLKSSRTNSFKILTMPDSNRRGW